MFCKDPEREGSLKPTLCDPQHNKLASQTTRMIEYSEVLLQQSPEEPSKHGLVCRATDKGRRRQCVGRRSGPITEICSLFPDVDVNRGVCMCARARVRVCVSILCSLTALLKLI